MRVFRFLVDAHGAVQKLLDNVSRDRPVVSGSWIYKKQDLLFALDKPLPGHGPIAGVPLTYGILDDAVGGLLQYFEEVTRHDYFGVIFDIARQKNMDIIASGYFTSLPSAIGED